MRETIVWCLCKCPNLKRWFHPAARQNIPTYSCRSFFRRSTNAFVEEKRHFMGETSVSGPPAILPAQARSCSAFPRTHIHSVKLGAKLTRNHRLRFASKVKAMPVQTLENRCILVGLNISIAWCNHRLRFVPLVPNLKWWSHPFGLQNTLKHAW